MNGAGDLPVEDTRAETEPRRDRRCLQQTGDERQRRGDEHRGEVGDDLQTVVVGEAFVGREVQRGVLHCRG